MTAAAIGHTYRHPKPRPTRVPPPRALAVTIARYREDFEARHGPLFEYFAARCPALYDAGRPQERKRGLRSDGADSLLCVIVALLQSMDLRRGFLGRPPLEAGGKWHRRSVLELFGFAFGKPVRGALSVRRIERWLRALRELGIINAYQLRRKTARGYESVTAIRHVTDRLFELAGTIGQLARERRQAAERVRAERQARLSEITREGLGRAAQGSAGGSTVEPVAPAPRPLSRAGPESAASLLNRITGPLRRA